MSVSGKPSREQLEEHYKTSRKYFDDMAEHYKETDPDYYHSTIAPIIRKHRYSNAAGYDETTAKRSMALTVVAVLVLVGVAMGVFFILSTSSEEPNPVDKMYEQMEKGLNEDGTQKAPAPIRETQRTIESDPSLQDGTEEGLDDNMSDFEKGVFYYDQAAYGQAASYFGKVKPGDPNYDDAQKYISEISNMPEDERRGLTPKNDAPQVNPNKK
jgi:hypothetical protein